MDIFAIRHKPTGKFLPAAKTGRTQCGPEPFSKQPGPRFFITHKSARQALHAWLRGWWKVEHEQSGAFGEEVDTYIVPEFVAGRRREDMEIAHYHLKEVQEEPQ